LILPLVWSVPEALVTAELATTFPENCGYVAWVSAAFGPFWGFMEGFWKWVSGVTDNAIYPVLFSAYLETMFPSLSSGLPRLVFLSTFTGFLTWLNWRGLTIVGQLAISLAFVTLLPFVVMIILSLPRLEPKRWVRCELQEVQWGPFLNIMFWNLNYFDSCSTLAGEVKHPRRTFPRALLIAVALIVVSYLTPLLIGLGTDATPDAWTSGHYATVAFELGGPLLQIWVIGAAAVSNAGQFLAEMSSDSFQLLGMAERGFLPSVLAQRSRHGTPTLAIILSSLGVIGITCLNFLEIVELLNAIYCLAELVEFSAFLWLRIKAPELKRPYRVPLDTIGLCLVLTPATVLLGVMIAMPIMRRNLRVLLYCGVGSVCGGLLYYLMQFLREGQWCHFHCAPPQGVHDLALAFTDSESSRSSHSSGTSGSDRESRRRRRWKRRKERRRGRSGGDAASWEEEEEEGETGGVTEGGEQQRNQCLPTRRSRRRRGVSLDMGAPTTGPPGEGGGMSRAFAGGQGHQRGDIERPLLEGHIDHYKHQGNVDPECLWEPGDGGDHYPHHERRHSHHHQPHQHQRRRTRDRSRSRSPETYLGALSQALGITQTVQAVGSVAASVSSYIESHHLGHQVASRRPSVGRASSVGGSESSTAGAFGGATHSDTGGSAGSTESSRGPSTIEEGDESVF